MWKQNFLVMVLNLYFSNIWNSLSFLQRIIQGFKQLTIQSAKSNLTYSVSSWVMWPPLLFIGQPFGGARPPRLGTTWLNYLTVKSRSESTCCSSNTDASVWTIWWCHTAPEISSTLCTAQWVLHEAETTAELYDFPLITDTLTAYKW